MVRTLGAAGHCDEPPCPLKDPDVLAYLIRICGEAEEVGWAFDTGIGNVDVPLCAHAAHQSFAVKVPSYWAYIIGHAYGILQRGAC